jgi:nicotinate-nucleotide--dimethylbenzimidazole phosphoribosyltransferase
VDKSLTICQEAPPASPTSSPIAAQENKLRGQSRNWKSLAKARLDDLTKPAGSLGQLEEIAIKMVSIQQQERPSCAHRMVYVFAADHGVTEEAVSAYPKEVTKQMVGNFLANGAAINALARCAGAEVIVVDVGVDAAFEPHPQLVRRKIRRGTRNMIQEPAMTVDELNAALNLGRSLIQQTPFPNGRLIALGEMGIGNTTAAAAITAALLGKPVEEVTGCGTGISPEALVHKREVVEKALQVNDVNRAKPMDVLQRVGGLEIAAMTGMVLEALDQRVAVVIDGFISTAAAAVAYAIDPSVKEVLFAGHVSQERGHRVLLEYIGVNPILDLGMRLG